MITTNLLHRLTLPFAVIYGILLLCVPEASAEGFETGMRLCVGSVLPALFPFFVVSNLMIHTPGNQVLGRPLRSLVRVCGLRSEDTAVLLMLSWLGGYAVCAKLIGGALRTKRIRCSEAQALLILGCCSSPGFVIGSVGGFMLGNLRLGILLYFLQLASNLFAAALLWAKIHPEESSSATGLKAACITPVSLPQAISSALDSSLSVCGCVLFFCVTVSAIKAVVPMNDLVTACLCAVLEISSGCYAFARLKGAAAVYGICCCLGILSASVFSQIRYLVGSGIPLRWFALSRLCGTLFLCMGLRLCMAVLPGTAPVYSSLSERVIVTNRLPWDSAFLLLCFLCAVLYKLYGKNYNCK